MKLTTVIGLVMLFQTPFNGTQQQPPGGAIEGIVVRIVTGEPIAGVRILVQHAAPPLPASGGGTPQPPDMPGAVTTDVQGRFVIKDLEPGSYRLYFWAAGYVRQELGQRAPVNVSTGQTVRGIQMALTPTASISGRVRDLDGKPLASVPIQVLKPVYNFLGERTFQSAGAASTDDRGEYRVFWVTPGRYLVLAGSAVSVRRPSMMGMTPNEVPGYGAPATYYPNAIEPSGATAVDLQPGADLNAIDFGIERMPFRRIRGRVVDAATGRWPPAATVALTTRSAFGGTSSRSSPQSYNPADGTFEIGDVPPGLHDVVVEVVSPGMPAPPAPPPIVPPGSGQIGFITSGGGRGLVSAGAQIPVQVAGSDVDNVVITIGSAVSVPGRLIIQGASTGDNAARLRVQLTPSSRGGINSVAQGPQPATADSTGEFSLNNVLPGEYRVQVGGLLPDFYVKQIRFDSEDVLSKPLNLPPSARGRLEVIVSARSSRLEGIVTDEKSQPVASVQTVLVPDQDRERPDLFRNVTTDQNGRFRMEGLAPGNYKVFAWEALEQFSYYDGDFLRRHEQRGQPVSVSESSHQTVQVRLIRR
jgi:hypothetical protein